MTLQHLELPRAPQGLGQTLGYIRLEHCPTEQLTKRGLPTDAGYDLHIADRVELPPSHVIWEVVQTHLIGEGPYEYEVPRFNPYKLRTGVIIVPPPNTWVGVYARSSLAPKHGLILANGVGVIDGGYTGEVLILLGNLSSRTVTLEAGTAVAQLIIHPLIGGEAVELTSDPRTVQRGGFGSTGGYVQTT